MYIKDYSRFVNEKNHIIDYKSKPLLGADLSKEDEELFAYAFIKILSESKDDDTKKEIYSFLGEDLINESNQLNEDFFGKLKDRINKAAKVSKVLSDKAEDRLKKLTDKAKNAVSFVKNLLTKFKEWLTGAFTKMINAVKEKITGDKKFKDKVKEVAKKDKEGLITDIKTGKEVAAWYKKEFVDSLVKSAGKDAKKFFEKEQEPVDEKELAESLKIDEGKNVISTLVHNLEEKVPPFTWLHKVSQAGEKGVKKLVGFLSKLTKKLGGPSFELPVIAILIGIAIEYNVKSGVGHFILDFASGGVSYVIKAIKMIATVIAVIIAVDAMVGGKIGAAHIKREGGEKGGEEPKEEGDDTP